MPNGAGLEGDGIEEAAARGVDAIGGFGVGVEIVGGVPVGGRHLADGVEAVDDADQKARKFAEPGNKHPVPMMARGTIGVVGVIKTTSRWNDP